MITSMKNAGRCILGDMLLGLAFVLGVGFTQAGAQEVIEISSIEELQKIGNDAAYLLDGNYVLTQDIDASDMRTWNEGAGFEPIGDFNNRFTDSFDGQGHVITDLFINRPEERHVGLVGIVDGGGVVRNPGLLGATVPGHGTVGRLVFIQPRRIAVEIILVKTPFQPHGLGQGIDLMQARNPRKIFWGGPENKNKLTQAEGHAMVSLSFGVRTTVNGYQSRRRDQNDTPHQP